MLYCYLTLFVLYANMDAQSGIPVHLLDTVWAAMRHKRASPQQQMDFEESLHAAPTLEEFEKELSGTPHRSAGGPTGVTYNAIVGWPRELLAKVHSLLLEF